jgi:hypothetical protein
MPMILQRATNDQEGNVNPHSDETRIGATVRLMSRAEQAEGTGTIEIQRLLAWYYSTDQPDDPPAAPRQLHDAA